MLASDTGALLECIAQSSERHRLHGLLDGEKVELLGGGRYHFEIIIIVPAKMKDFS
ncbi:MAG: hypothetical protein J5I81_08450 [Nitrococcus mobilis]|nr:hypothetical protein [Nitrococcus mobilis]